MTKKDVTAELTMIGGSGALLAASENIANQNNDDRRFEIRYDIQVPCEVRRVMPNGDVDLKNSRPGFIWDVSRKGVGIITEPAAYKAGSSLLINTMDDSGTKSFQSISIVNIAEAENGKTRINGIFGGPLGPIFEDEMLFPRINPSTLQFDIGIDDAQLANLASLGAIQSKSLDFVSLCPKCFSVPTVRQGCCRCLSGHVSSAKMIHHYACANVDFAENFEYEGQLICAKCRAKRLIVGADFEYLEGPNRCADCHQSNLELTMIGHCMSCNFRFPMQMAENMEITGYRVARMDILALINTA